MTSTVDRILDRLIARHGMLFSAELGIDLAEETPSALFRWLCAALLMSARIAHGVALDAARALADEGWTTAQSMADSAWEDRVRVLNGAGYARYDESTARMLGETADLLLRDYDGDLRKLRSAAGDNAQAQRARLKAFKGIGDVGADIFLREMQGVWPEHFPLLDAKARSAAARLGLPDSAADLAEAVGRARFPALVAALVRAELEGVDREDILGGEEQAT